MSTQRTIPMSAAPQPRRAARRRVEGRGPPTSPRPPAEHLPGIPAVATVGASGSCVRCETKLAEDILVTRDGRGNPNCLPCAGLANLIVVPSGDVALTRRAQSQSGRVAILIGWSPRSKRWERRGTLVEPRALVSAKAQCEADSEKRNVARQRASERRVIEDREYHAQFRAAVLHLYPGCPRAEATDIASHACEKHSGRVGRTADAKALEDEAVRLAVIAHVRHLHTNYDTVIDANRDKRKSRSIVRGSVQEVLAAWASGRAAPTTE